MKQVLIIIRPNMYFKTREALVENNFQAMSEKDVLGRGKQSGEYIAGTGEEVHSEYPFLAKKMIEIYCRDEDLERLIETVEKINQTGSSGDGKIFVLPTEDVIRIRTGEEGINAIM